MKPERDPETDMALMQRVTDDPTAQEVLARRVMSTVRARTRALCRTAADADDATQASMIEILRSAKGYRGEGSIESWCDRIAVRTTLRHQRRQARRLSLIDHHVDPDSVRDSRCQPIGVLNLVHAYLGELSAVRREAMLLRLKDYSVNEIAELTGASPNTVKDRLRMARRQLRQLKCQREAVASIRRSST